MKQSYIDIHSHLNLSPLWDNKETVIQKMREEKTQTVVVGVDFDTSKRAIELTKDFSDICIGATVGQHPNDNPSEVFELEKFATLAQYEKVVAIGECGVDYFRLHGTDEEKELEKKRQEILFKKHIEVSRLVKKPLMIHARPSKGTMDAYEKVLDILEQEHFEGNVNFHFFVGDVNTAKRIIKNNWSISFDGPITFTVEYDDVIQNTPLENIMCETDAPFAAPIPYRGKTCEPWMVQEVVKKIALLKEMSVSDVNVQMWKNFERYIK